MVHNESPSGLYVYLLFFSAQTLSDAAELVRKVTDCSSKTCYRLKPAARLDLQFFGFSSAEIHLPIILIRRENDDRTTMVLENTRLPPFQPHYLMSGSNSDQGDFNSQVALCPLQASPAVHQRNGSSEDR